MHTWPRPASAPYVAEFLGTFALVFAGAGAAAVDFETGGRVTPFGVGAGFGLIVMAMIFTFGHISGCHINPAISLASWIARQTTGATMLRYVAAQVAGATAGAAAVWAILGESSDAIVTQPAINGPGAALAAEFVLTYFLALVVLSVATDARAQGAFAAIAIGGYIAVAAAGWGPVAGSSMNPARSFGPAVTSGSWDSHWVYWLGPAAGAAAAAFTYGIIREPAPLPATAEVAAEEATVP